MKYALADGQRREPQPGLLGECPSCNRPMVAKCGKIKVWHWAHIGRLMCDPWWDNETPWHRAWKNQFPTDWQERVHKSSDGEKHIADVKTDKDWVLEFQHSFLRSEERQARNTFYEKLVWVVDGTRLKRDRTKFFNLVKGGAQFRNTPAIRLNGFLDDSALLRDWAGSHAPVFFDFGEEWGLWYLLPHSSVSLAYVVKFSHAYFIKLQREGGQIESEFEFWFKELGNLVSDYHSQLLRQASNQSAQPPNRSMHQGHQRHLARQIFARSRKRF